MKSQNDENKYQDWMEDAISVFRFVYHLPEVFKRRLFIQLIDEDRAVSAYKDQSDWSWEWLREQIFRYSNVKYRDTILAKLGFKREVVDYASIFDARPSEDDYKCPFGTPLPSSRTLGDYYKDFMVEMSSDPMDGVKAQYVEMLGENKITVKDDYRESLECDQPDGRPKLAVLNAFRSWYLDSSDDSSLQDSFVVMYYWYIDAMLIDEIIHLLVHLDSCRVRQLLQEVIFRACINDPNLLKIMRRKCKDFDCIYGSKLLDLLPVDGPGVESLGMIKLNGGIDPELFAQKLYECISDNNKLTLLSCKLNKELKDKKKKTNIRTQYVQYDRALPIIVIPEDEEQAKEQKQNFINAFLPNKKVTPIKLNCKTMFLCAIYIEIRDDGSVAEKMCDIFRVWAPNNTLVRPNPTTIETNTNKLNDKLEYRLIQHIIEEVKKNHS